MQLVTENDDAAFAILYERHTNVAFSLAFRMCGERQVAEEVVQEVFLSAWRSGARYDRTRGSVRAGVLGSSTTARSTRCVGAWSTSVAGSVTRASRSVWRRLSAPTMRSVAATRPARSGQPWMSSRTSRAM